MAHETAKSLLERAQTPAERAEAIKAAVALGMPPDEIQHYLDQLDAQRGGPPKDLGDEPC